MGRNSRIEWTHHSFNPWVGCSKVSPACKNCYAEGWAKRSGLVQWGDQAERRRTSESNWRQPLKWNKEAKQAGERRRVFCASLADVFEARAELTLWRGELFKLIQETPHLDWLLLTKRPENVMPSIQAVRDALSYGREKASAWLNGYPPKNVWLGTTVENQEMADKRIPELLKIPAAVRFLSCEPLLGPIDLTMLHYDGVTNIDCLRGLHGVPMPHAEGPSVDWVIVGGESGAKARPMHPTWAQSLRNQCQAAGVPFFFKQWGEIAEVEVDRPTQEVDWEDQVLYPLTDRSLLVALDGEVITRKDHPREEVAYRWMERVGKKAAGRLLDGRQWNEFPEVTA